jgi:hypothetical protein
MLEICSREFNGRKEKVTTDSVQGFPSKVVDYQLFKKFVASYGTKRFSVWLK